MHISCFNELTIIIHTIIVEPSLFKTIISLTNEPVKHNAGNDKSLLNNIIANLQTQIANTNSNNPPPGNGDPEPEIVYA